MLLSDLEKGWPESIYQTPYSASFVDEPGKPPIVSMEGNSYQTELRRRLNEVSPSSNPAIANRQKAEIKQQLVSDILAGRFRYEKEAGNIKDNFPMLKLKEKIKEDTRLSDSEVESLGELFQAGGAKKIKETHGVDFYYLNGLDILRVTQKADERRLRLEALKADSFFGRIFTLPDEAEMAQIEKERQQMEESLRLVIKSSEMNDKLWKGE